MAPAIPSDLTDRERAVLAAMLFDPYKIEFTSTDVLNVCPRIMHLMFGPPAHHHVMGRHRANTASVATTTCKRLVKRGLLVPASPVGARFAKTSRSNRQLEVITYSRGRFRLSESGFYAVLSFCNDRPLPLYAVKERRNGRDWYSIYDRYAKSTEDAFLVFAGLTVDQERLARIVK